MAKAFIDDYMVKRYPLENSGWRSLLEASAGSGVPPRTMYGRENGFSPFVNELLKRGAVESRVFPGKRGRGGLVSKLRVAYDRKPVQAYVDRAALGAAKVRGLGASLDRSRVAVLPFSNLSPNPGDMYLADGLFEEVISRLSMVSGLTVISRTSAMSYRGTAKTAREIGQELSVGSILEGSLRKAGRKVRVTVQLIDTNTDGHIWTNSFDKSLGDIFAIQSDVASMVAKTLSVEILRTPADDTKSVEAYTLFLKAMRLSHEETEESLREAVRLFERAVSVDRGFARAYAGLSQSWATMAHSWYGDFTADNERAEAAARKALEFGPRMAEAHAAMAHVDAHLDRFDEAISEAEKAISINQNFSEAYMILGVQHCNVGAFDEGLSAFKKAYELDPLSISVGGFLADVLQALGRSQEAVNLLERMRELNPRNPSVYVRMVECYIRLRKIGLAEEALKRGLKTDPADRGLRLQQGRLHAIRGRRREAEEALQAILRDREESTRLNGQLYIQLELGNFNEALGALEKQFENHSWPWLISADPVFDPLRADPRFRRALRQVGMASSERPQRRS